MIPQSFSNAEFELPMIPDGDSFRVHADVVAPQLAFRDASEMVLTLDDDEKLLVKTGAFLYPGTDQRLLRAGLDRGVWYLTEPGFYRAVGQRDVKLIEDVRCREAVYRFQRWTFHEVLPAMVRARCVAASRLAGTTWSWDEVAAEIRQRYGLDYKPTEITSGLRAARWLKAGGTVPKHEHRWKFWHTGTAYHLLPQALPEVVAVLIPTMKEIGDPQANQYQLNILPELGAPPDSLS